MVSLRFYKRHYDCPTNAALLLVGKDPRRFMPGAYVQYVSWGGMDNASQILSQRIFEGNLCTLLPQLETVIDMAMLQRVLFIGCLQSFGVLIPCHRLSLLPRSLGCANTRSCPSRPFQ